MTLEAYLPVLIQMLLALAIAGGIIAISHVCGQRASGNYIKDAAYECGLKPEGVVHPRFGVKFYVVAMLFILFDIEVVFLFPWVITYRDMLAEGINVLWPMLFFMVVLTIGLAYEIKKKGIDWDRKFPGQASQ